MFLASGLRTAANPPLIVMPAPSRDLNPGQFGLVSALYGILKIVNPACILMLIRLGCLVRIEVNLIRRSLFL